MPLAASLYYSKELSRHGKGAAALLYFGDKVRLPWLCAALASATRGSVTDQKLLGRGPSVAAMAVAQDVKLSLALSF